MIHADFRIQNCIRLQFHQGIHPLLQCLVALMETGRQRSRRMRLVVLGNTGVENVKRETLVIKLLEDTASECGPHRMVVDVARNNGELDLAGCSSVCSWEWVLVIPLAHKPRAKI